MTPIADIRRAGVITPAPQPRWWCWATDSASSTIAESAIALVAPAVLTAIVASALVLDHGESLGRTSPQCCRSPGRFVAVRRTANVGTALAVGLPIYWIATSAMTVAGLD